LLFVDSQGLFIDDHHLLAVFLSEVLCEFCGSPGLAASGNAANNNEWHDKRNIMK
jgi:hypothetical protein